MGRGITYGLSSLIQAGSITSEKIKDGTVAAADMAAGVIPQEIVAGTAAEAIDGGTTPRPVTFQTTDGSGVEGVVLDAQSSQSQSYGREVYGSLVVAQDITLSGGKNCLTHFDIYTAKIGSPGNNLIATIYAADASGRPTGSALGSVVKTPAEISGAGGIVVFTPGTPIMVTANSRLAIVFSTTGGDNGNKYYFYTGNFTTSPETNHVSTDGGTTWTEPNLYMDIFGKYYAKYTDIHVGHILIAQANGTTDQKNFTGLAISTAAESGSVNMAVRGIIGGFTGLTPGATYYVSNTKGILSTTPGTTTIKVGQAVSTTQILIDR